MFKRNIITKIVAVQSLIVGLWLFFHHGKANYTQAIQGFKHTAFLNSPYFYLSVISLGIVLLVAAYMNSKNTMKYTLIIMNAIWATYTVVLIINEINGVPNLSWALMLGYNIAIYTAARYEVNNE